MVLSPCIGVCRMDTSSNLCVGCGRSSAEIATWRRMSEEEQRRILAELPARHAQLSERIRRLEWSVADVLSFVMSTLKPGAGTWVTGIHGAVAEFCIDNDENVVFEHLGHSVSAATARGAISFSLSDRIHVLSLGASHTPAESDMILLAVCRKDVPAAAHGLTFIGEDGEAIGPENRHEILVDFGLGSAAASFCIRTADRTLIASLNGWRGQAYPAFLASIGGDILRASPTRVIRNAIGRIEVFVPIPPPGGRSPPGPHTHFLPEYLAQGGDLQPNLQISATYVPCFIHYPAPTSSTRKREQ